MFFYCEINEIKKKIIENEKIYKKYEEIKVIKQNMKKM